MTNKKNVKPKYSRKKRVLFMLMIFSLFFVILVSSVFSDWMQISENINQTKDLSQKYDELLEEEASLKSEVTKLHDPEYIARYAREKYMYTKEDGEMILKIVDADKDE